MNFLLSVLFLFSVSVSAQMKHAPKSFSTIHGNAVFIDIETADYDLTYNLANQTAIAKATLVFDSFEEGLPVFDVVAIPMSVLLDGHEVAQTLIKTPMNESSVRLVLEKIKPGRHTLEVTSAFTDSLRFVPGSGVNSAFWFSDLDDRSYLENYTAANFEYDQMKITFNVKVEGNSKQKIFTNGKLTTISPTEFKIEFPEYFTSSSLYYHLVPVGRYYETNFTFKSKDGRDIPVAIYTGTYESSLAQFKTEATRVLNELENDYGAFPHPSVTIFNAGSGGMEYCGATMTEFRALGHELTHSYFARGVMPANGNAGWLDEAIASWRDKGYQSLSSLNGTSGMAGHEMYTRLTDMDAYSFGASFMAYLNSKLASKGGLKPYLSHLVETKVFDPLVTEEFSSLLSDFSGIDMKPEFSRYVYRDNKATPVTQKSSSKFHYKMHVKDFKKLL